MTQDHRPDHARVEQLKEVVSKASWLTVVHVDLKQWDEAAGTAKAALAAQQELTDILFPADGSSSRESLRTALGLPPG